MAGNLTALDLMRPAFVRLGAGHTLREALGLLLDPQARREEPRVLVILGSDGSFAGLMTARDLLRALLPDWARPDAAEEDWGSSEKVLASLSATLNLKVTAAINPNVPQAAPGDRLPRLIQWLRENHLECLPVVENTRVLGLVHLADVFNAAAGLALGAQSEQSPSGEAGA